MLVIDIYTHIDTYIHSNTTIYESIIINMKYNIYLINIVSVETVSNSGCASHLWTEKTLDIRACRGLPAGDSSDA